METREIKVNVKVETLVIMLIWAVVSLFNLVIMFLSGAEDFWSNISVFLVSLFNALMSLSALNLAVIRFDWDGVVLKRRIFKPIALPYSSFRYAQNSYLIFTGYELNLTELQNKDDVLAKFHECAEAGLLHWQERTINKRRAITAGALAITGVLLFAGVWIYFGFIREDMQTINIVSLALLTVFSLYLLLKKLYRRLLRARMG